MFKINKLFFLVLGIILVAIYFSLPPLGLYCNDGGAKYMQMKAFASNGWKSIEIDYPAKNIDPELKHTGEQRILLTKDGKFLCSYNPAFTFISSLFYPLLG
ncbi:MAG: hypothetical protein HQ564_01655, partial [Candidatus Saganbacteria bacterium]|nr:hypothetical protein [Candidatus Saganbacteria bacterium]